MINLQINPNTQWTLAEFAITANDLLPQILPVLKPNAKSNTKLSEEISPRLIRYYTSQGIIDDPIREGKYAFYNRKHLLQLLVCRRLLVEGFTVAVIQAITLHKTDTELEAMLTGGIEFNLNAATHNTSGDSENSPNSQIKPQILPSHWVHIPIREGVEIHLRSDFVLPKTAMEYQHFLKEIELALKQQA